MFNYSKLLDSWEERPLVEFDFVVLFRKKPVDGLGGKWERQAISVGADSRHDARRMLLEQLLDDGYRVKSIVDA